MGKLLYGQNVLQTKAKMEGVKKARESRAF